MFLKSVYYISKSANTVVLTMTLELARNNYVVNANDLLLDEVGSKKL